MLISRFHSNLDPIRIREAGGLRQKWAELGILGKFRRAIGWNLVGSVKSVKVSSLLLDMEASILIGRDKEICGLCGCGWCVVDGGLLFLWME
jgi:hypothetical protein